MLCFHKSLVSPLQFFFCNCNIIIIIIIVVVVVVIIHCSTES